jgi:DNA (cytosine-5)-methyltransferase 1
MKAPAVKRTGSTPLRTIDLFAGIGGMRLGFEHIGGQCVFSSELDEDAKETYQANFGERPHGDITQIAPESIPDHDILLAGFPCQPFSIIGARKGFADTRGTLFFNIEQILKAKRPRAVLLENVKQFKTHNQGHTFATVVESMKVLGYNVHAKVLNALDYGVCQRRERTFIVGFQDDVPFAFPEPSAQRPTLAEILEPDDAVSPSLWASEAIREKRLARAARQGLETFRPSIWHENLAGQIGIFGYSCALRANASYNYMLVNGERRPTGRELLRLQGFPDSFKIAVKHTAIRKQAGNSVAVPVIRALAGQMALSLLGSQHGPNHLRAT